MVINHRQSSYRLQQGVMIIEALVVICVLVSLMSLGAKSITKNAERTVNQVTAQQLQQITQAAQYYIQDHYLAFKNDPNLKLDWQQLVDDGYLSNHQLSKNHYGQAYDFTITQQQGLLQLLLTTQGGHPINEQSLRQIAALAGSSAGYVSGLDPGKIIGNQQSWVLAGTSLPPGHLASLTIVNEQEVMDAATFLRRTPVAGHPDYNTMQADLEIDNHLLKITDSSAHVTLSSRKITLQNPIESDSTKLITLNVEGSPVLTLKDTYNPFGGINGALSSDRLEFIRDSDGNEIKLDNRDTSIRIKNKDKNIYIEGARPEIILEDKTKTWSSGIKPSEIRLESQASGNKSYVGNDKIVLSNKYNNNTMLDASNLSLNNQIMVDRSFIKIPFYAINDVRNPYDIQAVV
ncbi:shufflon system plasmid conjugative transfer pilus tip adhesin PilV [unidentified bacterial endosymbiont]|uniref:shufflon system plasmid conjugative transfer pilus tip adhesin PilV n=1 Tax=unidentified bacterial endosymbiont TaxID=2355 RepID=UPI00209CCCAA|nr:shufflon system plasmid conjugative transfer pilus tip adhesin PilV [unidentified bacterial endosymbiont]